MPSKLGFQTHEGKEGGREERRGEIQRGSRKRKLKAVPEHMERIIHNIGIQRKKSLHDMNE